MRLVCGIRITGAEGFSRLAKPFAPPVRILFVNLQMKTPKPLRFAPKLFLLGISPELYVLVRIS